MKSNLFCVQILILNPNSTLQGPLGEMKAGAAATVMLSRRCVWCNASSVHPLINAHGMMGEETGARDSPKAVGPERKSVTPNPIFFSLCLMCNYVQLLPKYLQNHDHRWRTVHLTAAATVPWPEAGPVREWTSLGLLHLASPGSSGPRSLAPAVPPPPSKQRWGAHTYHPSVTRPLPVFYLFLSDIISLQLRMILYGVPGWLSR